MKHFAKVREDLSEIRYYYSLKDIFDKGEEVVSPSILKSKVEKYNNAIANAPAPLYAYYIAYFVNNEKQVVIANNWGVAIQYVKSLNYKLCEYFHKVLA